MEISIAISLNSRRFGTGSIGLPVPEAGTDYFVGDTDTLFDELFVGDTDTETDAIWVGDID